MLRRHGRIILAPGLLMAIVAIVALTGCGTSASGASNAGSNSTNCASSSAPICTRSVQVNGVTKQALVTPNGMTLYYFTPDTATTVACTGGCATTWPPLFSSSATVGPISGLSGTLATVSSNGGTQITYNGHPLYTYASDTAPGDVKGEGIKGKWFIATVDLATGNSNDSGYGY